MMQSTTTRLRRAERDLARAEASLDRIRRYEPSLITDASEIAEMRDKAEGRVYRPRARVSVRREAVQWEEAHR